MARSIAIIKQQIIDAKNGEELLAGLNSPSQSSLWNLWAYITAVAINLHEQLWDIFQTEIETIASSAAPGTPQWLRDKTLKFQYSATNPQILQLIDFIPQYTVVDPTLRLVTQCSVKLEGNRIVLLKVAKGTDTLTPLGIETIPPNTLDNNPEINALKTYIENIKFAGTSIQVISLQADRLQVYADVYYDGQYVLGTVKDNVKTAIATYLKNLPFDGLVSNTKLIDAIQAVQGVLDVQLQKLGARAFEQSPLTTTNLVDSYTVLCRNYATIAGYIIPEDATGFTLDDTLNVTVAS
jgi:hypothetical protein